ncbi:MAG: porin family protein [Chitinophagales bacterium]|nr:porin family protein [Chitinophagales bacterium]
MKKIFIAAFIVISCAVFAQQSDEQKKETAKQQANEAADRLVVGFTFDNWIYDRDKIDSLGTEWNSWGIQLYYMYDIPMGKSRFSFAPGLGFSASWVKNNSLLDESVDSIGTIFRPIQADYKRNSLVTSYFDIPLELRFRGKVNSKNKSFKMAAGVVGGVQMTHHTKTKTEISGETKIFKQYRYDDLMKFRFGPTFRIGYGSVNLSFYYSVLSLFKNDLGPDVHPFSVGFTINGL